MRLFGRRNSLNKVKVGFGVGELLDLLDLQAPVLVSNDLRDVDRFTDRLHPDHGLQLAGDLWPEWVHQIN